MEKCMNNFSYKDDAQDILAKDLEAIEPGRVDNKDTPDGEEQ
jgi:hypothetical protein